MTPPPVLYNSYVENNDKVFIDVASKIFILSELPFGIIRVQLLWNIPIFFKFLAVLYSLFLACFYVSIFFDVKDMYYFNIIIWAFSVQCIFFMVFNFISIKRLQSFYSELNNFDKEVGCRPKITKGTVTNLIHTLAIMLYTVIWFSLPHITITVMPLYLGPVPFILSNILEVHYCGHLLSLLTPRMRIINYFMELSLSNCKITKEPNVEEFGLLKACNNKSLCDIEKLMDLYHNMIKTYNYLVEAVKWQLVVSIVATFISNLAAFFDVYLLIIKQNVPLIVMAAYAGVSVSLMLPLFSPCILGDQVKKEVLRLRELLASRLYENKLDKSSRSTARALLAWTETRDLSFSLLRMLDIDISLPFKFVGLFVTYLIILLQFQKVINP